jgi:UDP-glucose 4-epimerase
MTVWITGARGFIGRHLARHLAEGGQRVVGIGHGQWDEKSAAEWGIATWINADITPSNLDQVSALEGPPDVLYHLAGASSVGLSFSLPHEDFHRSAVAAASLCEWLRLRHPQTVAVMASSAAVYGAGHDDPIAETTPAQPYSPYGFHKRMAELAFECYSHSFGLRTAIVRLFSVYGEELRKQLLWDACCKLRDSGGQLALGGTGLEMRDWLHVSDAVRILELAGRHASASGYILNGGTGTGTPVTEIADLIRAAWHVPGATTFSGTGRPGDPDKLVASSERLAALGFESHTSVASGIRNYVQWFRKTAG